MNVAEEHFSFLTLSNQIQYLSLLHPFTFSSFNSCLASVRSWTLFLGTQVHLGTSVLVRRYTCVLAHTTRVHLYLTSGFSVPFVPPLSFPLSLSLSPSLSLSLFLLPPFFLSVVYIYTLSCFCHSFIYYTLIRRRAVSCILSSWTDLNTFLCLLLFSCVCVFVSGCVRDVQCVDCLQYYYYSIFFLSSDEEGLPPLESLNCVFFFKYFFVFAGSQSILIYIHTYMYILTA